VRTAFATVFVWIGGAQSTLTSTYGVHASRIAYRGCVSTYPLHSPLYWGEQEAPSLNTAHLNNLGSSALTGVPLRSQS